MPQSDNWLDKLYIRDIWEFLTRTFSALFPEIDVKITDSSVPVATENKAVVIERVLSRGGSEGGFSGFLKSLFMSVGVSVFLVSVPLIGAVCFQQFRSSRLFTKETIINGGIVVTGCDSGIGIETAALLSVAHPNVMIFAGCRTVNGIDRLTALRRRNLYPSRVDVTVDEEVHNFAAAVRTELRDRNLYAIVNNAGVFDGTLFEATSTKIYKSVMEVNFFGVVRVTKAFLPLMARGDGRRLDGGRIINITSIASMLTSPGNTAYCASKYALTALSDGLRQELREVGIKVTQIVPGPVRTDSLRQIAISSRALLTAGPPNVLQRIGGQAFLAAHDNFFDDIYNSALPPLKIAKLIEQALVSKHPKDVYYHNERIYNFLSVCPHFMRDFLMDPRSFRKQVMARYA